jgi:hypothetical protein
MVINWNGSNFMSRIVFHHIDKCAGTSLLKYLQNLFPSEQCVYVENYCNWTNVASIDLDANCMARSKFIHDPYGTRVWADHLANVDTICFLRDPLERLVSNWWMVHRWTEEEVNSFPDGKFIHDLVIKGPEHFFTSEHPQCRYLNWNRISRHLACAPTEYYDAWRTNSLDSDSFRNFIRQRAEKVLRSMSFIGFKEDFNRSLSALQFWLSLPIDQPQPLNVHGSAQKKLNLSAEALDAANRLIDIDLEIVAIARELYHEQMERFESNFGKDFLNSSQSNYLETLLRNPHWDVVDMSQPLNGTGWHARELNGNKFSRWIGPTPKATIDIPLVKTNDIFIRFRVTNVLSARQIDELTLLVDSQSVVLHHWLESEFVHIFDAVVPVNKLNQTIEVLQLTFDCVETIILSETDGRHLGLEICEIEVGPAYAYELKGSGTPEVVRGRLGRNISRND